MCNEICIDVCFYGIDLDNDAIIGVDGDSISSMTAMEFLQAYPAYELLTDHNGVKAITVTKTEQKVKSLTITGNVVVNAVPFIGGHPTRPPHR